MYGENNIDYAAEGVTPPEQTVHEGWEPMNVNPRWYQRGNYLFREGDELRYASKIPYGYILIGTDDDGRPILKKIQL